VIPVQSRELARTGDGIGKEVRPREDRDPGASGGARVGGLEGKLTDAVSAPADAEMASVRRSEAPTRTLLTLDERGHGQLSDLLLDVVLRALEIEAESKRRLGTAPGRQTELGVLHFDRR